MAIVPTTEEQLQQVLTETRQRYGTVFAHDGPFPLALEAVPHFGSSQSYRCWQDGPNSLVLHTLPQLFNDCSTRFGDQEALVYEGERQTFGDLIGSAVALSRDLAASYGVSRGGCVAIAGRNHPDWVISLVAVTGFLSAIALPVNSWWVDEELRYGLEDSNAVLLIADSFVLARAPFLRDIGVASLCMRGADASGRSFEEAVRAGRSLPPLPPRPVHKDDTAMLMYTSGTTSKPKGVVLTQRSVMAVMNFIRCGAYLSESAPQKTMLLASPFFHVTGSHVALLASFCDGRRLVTMYKWDSLKALQLVEAERITNVLGVPTNTYDLLTHPDFHKYDTSSLEGLSGGGAAFAAPMIKRVSDSFKNAKASTGYGLTETNALSVTMNSAFFPLRPKSCGMPTVYTDVAILGEKGEMLPAGEVGEICLRGASVMQGYWKKPDKTAEVFHFDAEGKLWFRTGDIGRTDTSGFVFIMDRAKDIIIRGGENISCAEVEDAVFEHLSVAEVAAFGVPHPSLGEVVAIAVVFKKGTEVPTDEELKQFVAARLAGFKVPQEVHRWTGDLPRGATGKTQKREIRDQIAARRETPPSRL